MSEVLRLRCRGSTKPVLPTIVPLGARSEPHEIFDTDFQVDRGWPVSCNCMETSTPRCDLPVGEMLRSLVDLGEPEMQHCIKIDVGPIHPPPNQPVAGRSSQKMSFANLHRQSLVLLMQSPSNKIRTGPPNARESDCDGVPSASNVDDQFPSSRLEWSKEHVVRKLTAVGIEWPVLGLVGHDLEIEDLLRDPDVLSFGKQERLRDATCDLRDYLDPSGQISRIICEDERPDLLSSPSALDCTIVRSNGNHETSAHDRGDSGRGTEILRASTSEDIPSSKISTDVPGPKPARGYASCKKSWYEPDPRRSQEIIQQFLLFQHVQIPAMTHFEEPTLPKGHLSSSFLPPYEDLHPLRIRGLHGVQFSPKQTRPRLPIVEEEADAILAE